MTSHAAVHMVAQRTANTTEQGHSTHSRGTGNTEGGGAWAVHAPPSHVVSVLSFVSACL